MHVLEVTILRVESRSINMRDNTCFFFNNHTEKKKRGKSRNLRGSVEVTIFYPSKPVERLTIFGSRLNLVLSIVISNTCIFYAANDRRRLGTVQCPTPPRLQACIR